MGSFIILKNLIFFSKVEMTLNYYKTKKVKLVWLTLVVMSLFRGIIWFSIGGEMMNDF